MPAFEAHGVSNVGKYNLVSYRQSCMLIRTINIVFSSLQHKLKQKYENAKNRISAKLIIK